MSDLSYLENLKKYLIENVANKIKLEKSREYEDEAYSLVNPEVYVGWIPPKNYLDEQGHDVPSILIMSDGGIDNDDEASESIRIAITTFDPGTTTSLGTKSNSKGYKDLLNVITLIRLALKDYAGVQKPIKWGMYDEQAYPYWCGWVTFDLKTLSFDYHDDNL